MSKKNFRKSISLKRENDTIYKETGDTYYHIIDFENATERKCRDYDKKNSEMYQKLLNIFNKQNKKLSKYSMQIENTPSSPPSPSNYEKLLLWKKRTIKINVEEQSVAILFLVSKGYKIRIPGVCDDGIEPYNAVKIAKLISQKESLNMKREIELFQINENLVDYYDDYDDDNDDGKMIELPDDNGEECFGFKSPTPMQSHSFDEHLQQLYPGLPSEGKGRENESYIPTRRNTFGGNISKYKKTMGGTNTNTTSMAHNYNSESDTSTSNMISPQTNIHIGADLASTLMGIKPAGHSTTSQPQLQPQSLQQSFQQQPQSHSFQPQSLQQSFQQQPQLHSFQPQSLQQSFQQQPQLHSFQQQPQQHSFHQTKLHEFTTPLLESPSAPPSYIN